MRVFALANDTEAQQFYETQGGVGCGVTKGINIGEHTAQLAVYSVHVPASQEDGEHVELLPDKGLLLETVPTTGTSSTPAAFLTIGIVLWAVVLSLARRHNDDSVKP